MVSGTLRNHSNEMTAALAVGLTGILNSQPSTYVFALDSVCCFSLKGQYEAGTLNESRVFCFYLIVHKTSLGVQKTGHNFVSP